MLTRNNCSGCRSRTMTNSGTSSDCRSCCTGFVRRKIGDGKKVYSVAADHSFRTQRNFPDHFDAVAAAVVAAAVVVVVERTSCP